MKPEKLLADISRMFLSEQGVIRYRTKKVSELNDIDVIKVCHSYCEEHDVVAEFKSFRERIETQYRYCDYLEEFVEDGLCYDVQMIANRYIKESALPDYVIDKAKAVKHCEECKYKMNL